MKFLLVSPGISQIFENTVDGHDNLVIPKNQDLALKIILDSPENQGQLVISEDIIKNFCAVLNKSWKFIFPNENRPKNLHHFCVGGHIGDFNHHRVLISMEERSVTVILTTISRDTLGVNESCTQLDYNGNSVSLNQLKSIIWRLSNAFEWCTLPNRKKLSGQSYFTKETWNAISVHLSSETLAKTILIDSSQDHEPVVSDPQVQTGVAE